MAVAYKSSGSGVGTQTSGAALNVPCPATVDKHDILIAHIYYRPNGADPATPSGWTLLNDYEWNSGASFAEHWVFGRIADGSEDGANQNFGSPAVTTVRAGRIHSFSGHLGGLLLTDIITGFANTNAISGNYTMPTITTTVTGALAVALVSITDDNAVANPINESGGDWTQPVSAYSTAAFATDYSLGINTATPTGNPGTISGGTAGTGGDFTGVTGFQILPGIAPPSASVKIR